MLAKLLGYLIGIPLDLLAKRADRNTLRKYIDPRQLRSIAAVHEHQPRRRAFDVPRLQLRRRQLNQGISRQPKLSARDRRDIGESPVFIAGRRETDFGETRERVLSQLSQPRKIPPRRSPLKVGEVLEMNPQILGRSRYHSCSLL